MREFLTLNAYRKFELSVKQKARFIHDEQVREFLQTVLDTSESFEEHVDVQVPAAHSKERMIPTSGYAGDGRVAPRGIPSLYLALDRDTATAEVRPWVGSYVSLAQFKVMRDCTVVDCSLALEQEQSIWLAFEDPSREDASRRETGVWGDIAHAFSKPVAVDEPHLDYIPTQILAEAFRGHGYDGIVYRSLLHEEGKTSHCSMLPLPS